MLGSAAGRIVRTVGGCIQTQRSFGMRQEERYRVLETLKDNLDLVATRNIWMGDEILWDYGREYWTGEHAKIVTS